MRCRGLVNWRTAWIFDNFVWRESAIGETGMKWEVPKRDLTKLLASMCIELPNLWNDATLLSNGSHFLSAG